MNDTELELRRSLVTDHDHDRGDYADFLREYGFTEELMQAIVQDRTFDHYSPRPEWFRFVRIGPSSLHGQGLFATEDLTAGQVLAPARIGGLRAPAGRWTNHAKNPNCVFVRRENGDLYLVAAREVEQGEELTMDYRQSGRVNGYEDQFPGLPAHASHGNRSP